MADAGPAERVTIRYSPRSQFLPFHERTKRFAVIVAHRRAGKTVACVNDLIRGAVKCPLREPRFAYVAPYFAQAKDVAWTYLKRFASDIPGAESHESELRVDLPTGARIRLYGADNYDRMRGGYLDGVVLDEYADMDPRAWTEVIGPMLADRKGWAAFIGTPKGRNAFCEVYEKSVTDPEWFSLMLRASETGLIDDDELARWRREMSEDQYAQEFECSFQAAVVGSYYGRELERAEKDKRITSVPWDPAVQVHTTWDLGIGDPTAIWFLQLVGKEIHWIDYLESSGTGLDWYANQLKERPYVYGSCLLPHDAEARELGSGKTRVETLESLGVKNIQVQKMQGVDDGINAARLLMARSWFDATKCARGIEALRQYRKKFDEKRKVFMDHPLHDWTSHGADAFRTAAQADLDSLNPSDWSKPLSYSNAGIV